MKTSTKIKILNFVKKLLKYKDIPPIINEVRYNSLEVRWSGLAYEYEVEHNIAVLRSDIASKIGEKLMEDGHIKYVTFQEPCRMNTTGFTSKEFRVEALLNILVKK